MGYYIRGLKKSVTLKVPCEMSVLPFIVLLFHFQEVRDESRKGIQKNIHSDGLETEPENGQKNMTIQEGGS